MVCSNLQALINASLDLCEAPRVSPQTDTADEESNTTDRSNYSDWSVAGTLTTVRQVIFAK